MWPAVLAPASGKGYSRYLVAAELHSAKVIPLDPKVQTCWEVRQLPGMQRGRKETKGKPFLGDLQTNLSRVGSQRKLGIVQEAALALASKRDFYLHREACWPKEDSYKAPPDAMPFLPCR